MLLRPALRRILAHLRGWLAIYEEEQTMKSTAFVLSTVVGMILVGVLATHVPAAEVITKTEKIT